MKTVYRYKACTVTLRRGVLTYNILINGATLMNVDAEFIDNFVDEFTELLNKYNINTNY